MLKQQRFENRISEKSQVASNDLECYKVNDTTYF